MKELKERFEKECMRTFKNRRADIVKRTVLDCLLVFCEQEPEFLQAVKDSNKCFEQCCDAIMTGVGSSISDIEVYRRMAAFYFPGAGVNMQMTINLSAEAEVYKGTMTQTKRAVVLDLFSELL